MATKSVKSVLDANNNNKNNNNNSSSKSYLKITTTNNNNTLTGDDLMKEQEDLLQCPICMDRLENPKDLLCNHTFCKSCLDDLLEFDPHDGSAIIQCPMKCKPLNYIDPLKTTNDLKTSYHLKSMLDWFQSKEEKETPIAADVSCQGEEDCTNTIITYCTTCSLMLCQSCQNKHTNSSPTPPTTTS
jgi:hypothetical protein